MCDVSANWKLERTRRNHKRSKEKTTHSSTLAPMNTANRAPLTHTENTSPAKSNTISNTTAPARSSPPHAPTPPKLKRHTRDPARTGDPSAPRRLLLSKCGCGRVSGREVCGLRYEGEGMMLHVVACSSCNRMQPARCTTHGACSLTPCTGADASRTTTHADCRLALPCPSCSSFPTRQIPFSPTNQPTDQPKLSSLPPPHRPHHAIPRCLAAGTDPDPRSPPKSPPRLNPTPDKPSPESQTKGQTKPGKGRRTHAVSHNASCTGFPSSLISAT